MTTFQKSIKQSWNQCDMCHHCFTWFDFKINYIIISNRQLLGSMEPLCIPSTNFKIFWIWLNLNLSDELFILIQSFLSTNKGILYCMLNLLLTSFIIVTTTDFPENQISTLLHMPWLFNIRASIKWVSYLTQIWVNNATTHRFKSLINVIRYRGGWLYCVLNLVSSYKCTSQTGTNNWDIRTHLHKV